MELTDSELNEMMLFARKTTRLLQLAFGSEGFDWSIQDGASAGQTVMHLHLHIVPRKTGDLAKGKEWFQLMKNNEKQMLDSKNRERLTDKEFAEITNMLKEKAMALEI